MFCIWEDDLRYLKRFIGVLDLYAGKVGRADGRVSEFQLYHDGNKLLFDEMVVTNCQFYSH